MLPLILSVVVISFSGVMLPGPLFAVLLAKSYKSPWMGAYFALGHAVVELPLILAIYFGLTGFFRNTTVQVVLSLIGGLMIIWMGISMFRSRTAVVRQGKDLPYNGFVAGIMLSGLNPFVLLWWAAIGSLLIMKLSGFGIVGLIIFFIVHWLCDLVWLSFVSNVVYRTHRFWGSKVQEYIFIGCSLLLVGFGGWYIISGIQAMV